MRIKIKLKKNMLLGNQINNFLLSILIFIFLFPKQIIAETISGNSVLLGGLDKITAKFTDFEINIGESKKFGTLSIKIFQCRKRPPEEIPEDFVLLTVNDMINPDNPLLIFSGWMFSSSPSLSALEHPTYDIWIKECKIN